MSHQLHVGPPVDPDTPVVILHSSREGFPQHGVLGVVRSLGRLGIGVRLASPTPDGIAARSRYLEGWISWSPDGAGALDRLVGSVDRGSRVPLLVPTDDRAVVYAEAHAEALGTAFQVVAPPGASDLLDKRRLAERCERLGVPAPVTVEAWTLEEVEAFVEQSEPPIVVKADVDALAAGVGRSVVVASTRDEVLRQAARFEGRRLLLQEYIPGRPDQVNWMFDAYLDGSSRCLFGATGRKLHQYPAGSGMATYAVSGWNEEVASVALRLLDGVGYVGPVDIDLRFDERDGRYKVVDVNPRVGGSFRLFVASNGMDVVRAMYLDLTGREVPTSDVADGRCWFVETHAMASLVAYRREGWLTYRSWVRSLRNVEEGALWGSDDLRPAFGALGRAAGRLVGRVDRRGRVVRAPRGTASAG
jgi:D-aspartate ligase